MRKNKLLILSIATFILLNICAINGIKIPLLNSTSISVNRTNNPFKIQYDIGTQTFQIYHLDSLIATYNAISGAPKTPTPEGTWNIIPNNISSKKTTFATTWGNYEICPVSNYRNSLPILAKYSDSNYTDGTILLDDNDYSNFFTLCQNKYYQFTIINTKPIFRELSLGSFGYDVFIVQTALKERGYSISNTNGYYTTDTKSAITQFQRDNTLYPSGKVNINTYLKLIRF